MICHKDLYFMFFFVPWCLSGKKKIILPEKATTFKIKRPTIIPDFKAGHSECIDQTKIFVYFTFISSSLVYTLIK